MDFVGWPPTIRVRIFDRIKMAITIQSEIQRIENSAHAWKVLIAVTISRRQILPKNGVSRLPN